MQSTDSFADRIRRKREEAQSFKRLQEILKRRNHTVSWLFSGGFYAIGAALLVLFLWGPLITPLPVALAALILILTFLQHYFRPDAKFVTAKTRILRLDRALYSAKTGLQARQKGQNSAPSPELIYETLAQTLEEVQRAQHLDYAYIRTKIFRQHNKS